MNQDLHPLSAYIETKTLVQTDMAASLTRPQQRNRQRKSRETTFEAHPSSDVVVARTTENTSAPTTTQSESIDEELFKKLKDVQEELQGLESQIASKLQKVSEKKTKAKKETKELFHTLHELLERKECELMSIIDDEFDKVNNDIEKDLDKLHCLTDPVEEMIDKHTYGVGELTNDMLRSLHISTQSQMHSAEFNYSCVIIPEFQIDTDCTNVIERCNFGAISGQDVDNAIVETESIVEDRNRSDDVGAQLAQSLSSQAANDNSSGENGNGDCSLATRDADCTGSVDGAAGYSSAGSVVPTAPPLMPEDKEEEDPPPYWQAVGLAGPTEDTSPALSPPLNFRTYRDPAPQYSEFDLNPMVVRSNALELWHSFPVRRQYDTRKPLYVALSWDDQRICVADRNNKKVKFFSRTGDPLTEMHITSGEIHDVAFLEGCRGEARYIITLPKERTLLLVAVMEDNTTKLVRKILMHRTGNYYSCICRGPKEQTLVGATTNVGSYYYTSEKPTVEMFDFDGNLLQVYKGAINFVDFEYPRAVDVCGDLIIVADWKLSLVAIFLSNGSQVGQYNGTPSSPLINPLSLTIDSYGNIMVVDGENPSIHVVSPQGLPIEVIKVPRCGSERSKPKLIAFDTESRDRLAVIRSTGDLAIFSFRDGYKVVRPGEVDMGPRSPVSVPAIESLPYVEGMLPTTIANIGRVRGTRNRTNFYL